MRIPDCELRIADLRCREKFVHGDRPRIELPVQAQRSLIGGYLQAFCIENSALPPHTLHDELSKSTAVFARSPALLDTECVVRVAASCELRLPHSYK